LDLDGAAELHFAQRTREERGLNLPSFLGSQADVAASSAAAQPVPTIPETKLDVKIDSPRRS
jgi:hypothetical protein